MKLIKHNTAKHAPLFEGFLWWSRLSKTRTYKSIKLAFNSDSLGSFFSCDFFYEFNSTIFVCQIHLCAQLLFSGSKQYLSKLFVQSLPFAYIKFNSRYYKSTDLTSRKDQAINQIFISTFIFSHQLYLHLHKYFTSARGIL